MKSSSVCRIAACLSLLLAGCGEKPVKETPAPAAQVVKPSPASTGVKVSGRPTHPTKRRMLMLAKSEWQFFGNQTVVYDGEEESIPHVGLWEDDDYARMFRVNLYWRAVQKPFLTGKHCQEPWSAAFISWVMATAGVPEEDFPAASAHWIYLSHILRQADHPYATFVPRTIREYRPEPGDLICASRGLTATPHTTRRIEPEQLAHATLHCDLVVEKNGPTLEAIGGNVRNSVSKSILKLDDNGYLQPTARRPWFLILENRM